MSDAHHNSADLVNAKNICIDRGELKSLREKADRADELDDEITDLIRQRRVQDENNAQLMKETARANDRLTNENAHLKREFESYKDLLVTVHNLENENQRLAQDLQETSQRAQKKEQKEALLAQSSKETSKSIEGAKLGEASSVQASKYHSLTTKYNKISQNNKDLTEANKRLQETLRTEREKGRDWKLFGDGAERIDTLVHANEVVGRILAGETGKIWCGSNAGSVRFIEKWMPWRLLVSVYTKYF